MKSMDAEKSSNNSSFEDLSNINEQDKLAANAKQQQQRQEQNSPESTLNKSISSTEYKRRSSPSPSRRSNSSQGISYQDDPEMPDLEKNEPDEYSMETNPMAMTNSSVHIGDAGDFTKSSPSTVKAQSSDNEEEEACDILGNGQLMKRVLIKAPQGDRRPIRGELVTISYKGMLANGTVVEDMSEVKVHVGDFEVVQAIDMILPLMGIGEKCEVVSDARFCYGALGLKNEEFPHLSIPPDANLTYEVHLLDGVYEDFADLKSYAIRKKYGTAKKERANFWYNRNEFGIAIQLYRRALEYLDHRDGDPDLAMGNEDLELTNKESQSLLDDRLVVYNNMAMAQIKMLAYDAALKSVENVLECQPNNSKALYRKGRILDGKGDTKGAIAILQKAATLETDNRTIQQDLARLIIKARREEHNEKEMYQKMLGQAKKLELKNKQTQKQQSVENSKLKILGYLMGSILIGVAGMAIYRYKY